MKQLIVSSLVAALGLIALTPVASAQEVVAPNQRWQSPEGAFSLVLPEGWAQMNDGPPSVMSVVTPDTIESRAAVYRGCIVVRADSGQKGPFDWDYLNRDTENWARRRVEQYEGPTISTVTISNTFVASIDGIAETPQGRVHEFVRTFNIQDGDGVLIYMVTCRIGEPEAFDMAPVNAFLSSLEFIGEAPQ